jgi:hypothetical protein
VAVTDDHDDSYRRAEKYFDVAADVRKFEIGLFWQRSFFFWGFIGAAFVAYSAMHNEEPAWSRIAIACFGLICSIAWTLLNRGSKYWQEAWETKVERKEQEVLQDRLFNHPEAVKTDKFFLLRARRYSVSKLVIALSDFTCLVWVFLLLVLLPWNRLTTQCCPWEFWALPAVIVYGIYMGVACRSTPNLNAVPP